MTINLQKGVIQELDLIVVGGGHAGFEAVHMSHQHGLKTGLVSLKDVPIVSAPCNPAVGGVGKGQVVREIDALGGMMGKLADWAGIQYRTLNEPKGYSVQSTRVQIDKYRYSEYAQREILTWKNVEIFYSGAKRITRGGQGPKNEGFYLYLEDGRTLYAKAVVITAGTFLGGLTHTGEKTLPGGRRDKKNSVGLKHLVDFPELSSSSLLGGKRFKTGTPPRIEYSSIDYSSLEVQPSDSETLNFHLAHHPQERHSPQVSCYLTRTTEKTFDSIASNLHRSPMFNGQITARGPRYCPSIEDKIHRYPERKEHHLFLEPESLDLQTVYPNGISTSLPEDVQEEIVRSIPGLENAKILIPGYAVEYDVVDTTQLDACLNFRGIPGLYFAGQLNGTSGYEEAAGQGLVAGINAARFVLNKGPWILDRMDSYIGVMVDDLIHQERDEPYRLFTARCENRLRLREDNAFIRMASYRKKLDLQTSWDSLLETKLSDYYLLQQMGPVAKIPGTNSPLQEFLKKHPKTVVQELQRLLEERGIEVDIHALRAYAIDCIYEGVAQKSAYLQEKIHRIDGKPLHYERLLESPNISFECKERIERYKPLNFRQLKNIPGIRAATVLSVLGQIS